MPCISEQDTLPYAPRYLELPPSVFVHVLCSFFLTAMRATIPPYSTYLNSIIPKIFDGEYGLRADHSSRAKAWTVFAYKHWGRGFESRTMHWCLHLFCVGRWSPSKEPYQMSLRLRNWSGVKRFTDALCSRGSRFTDALCSRGSNRKYEWMNESDLGSLSLSNTFLPPGVLSVLCSNIFLNMVTWNTTKPRSFFNF
jgi:hypothetical protein